MGSILGNLLSDSSIQRKLALAVCAALALFSSKIPFLADVKPEFVMMLMGAIATWIHQSGGKAAAEAHADGLKAAAMIANADDALHVFNQLAANAPAPLAAPAPPPNPVIPS